MNLMVESVIQSKNQIMVSANVNVKNNKVHHMQNRLCSEP